MHGRAFSSALGSALFVLVCAAPVPVLAQTDEQRAGARSLATEGAAAFNDGHFKEAVELFTKAETLVHAPPHLLFIARAHTKLGQFVKAREAYLKITREQLAGNAPPAFRDAQGAASREMAALEPKIGGLTIKVEGGTDAKDLQVKLDGNVVPSVLVGASQPIDPGEHRVEAVATGYRAQPATVTVGEGQKTSISLKVEVDANAAPAGAPPGDPAAASSAGGATVGGSAPPVQVDTGAAGGLGGIRIAAYSAFGVGAIGLGLGTVFLLKSGSNRSDADGICNVPPNNGCPAERKAEVEQLDSDANSARTIAVVGFVLGAASVGAGVALLVLDKSSSSDAKSAKVTPWVGLGSAGVSGRF